MFSLSVEGKRLLHLGFMKNLIAAHFYFASKVKKLLQNLSVLKNMIALHFSTPDEVKEDYYKFESFHFFLDFFQKSVGFLF